MLEPEKCKITYYPSPVLQGPARPVEQIDDTVRRLAERMIEIMIETKGIGLAGPQAGVDLAIFVISLDGTRENAKVYLNPTVETSGKLVEFEEGCLSIPGLYTKIKRYSNAKVTATDLQGNEFTEDAEGLYARALQHEYDHLQGRMIKDRMSRVAAIGARRKLKQLEQEYGEKDS